MNGEYTPQPPSVPKNSYNRNTQQTSPINTPTQSSSGPTFKENHYNRPPRPQARTSKKSENGYSSMDPSNESVEMNESEPYKNSKANGFAPIPPSNNPNAKLRPTFNGQRGGWAVNADRNHVLSVSSDRIPSASLKISRASSRNSFASEDLDKYMSHDGSINRPVPPPRITPTGRQPSASNRILSGRSQDVPYPQIFEATPPPVKPRTSVRSNSYTNLSQNMDDMDSKSFLKKMKY